MSKKEPTKALALIDDKNTAIAVPEEFTNFVTEAAEKGKSDFEANDLIIPALRILQGLSPQKSKASPEYIEGAEEGMFLNTATKELYDGGEGVVVMPCYYHTEWVEWKPKSAGGGLVKKWGKDESFMNQGYADEKGKWVKKDSDGKNEFEIVKTANYYCLMINPKTGGGKQCMVRMSSTQFKKSRHWNSLIDAVEIPLTKEKIVAGNLIPYWFMYHLTTVPESNDAGSWFGFRIEKYKPVVTMPNARDLLLSAKTYRELAMEGNIQVVDNEESDELTNNDQDRV